MRLGENQRFRWFRFHVAGALALLFFPVMAAAVVLFDARLGIGMVDAVDLVRLLSWSEQDLAQRHMTLRFNYQGTERYQVVCSGQGAAGGPRTNEIRMLERKVSFRVIALPMFDDNSQGGIAAPLRWNLCPRMGSHALHLQVRPESLPVLYAMRIPAVFMLITPAVVSVFLSAQTEHFICL